MASFMEAADIIAATSKNLHQGLTEALLAIDSGDVARQLSGKGILHRLRETVPWQLNKACALVRRQSPKKISSPGLHVKQFTKFSYVKLKEEPEEEAAGSSTQSTQSLTPTTKKKTNANTTPQSLTPTTKKKTNANTTPQTSTPTKKKTNANTTPQRPITIKVEDVAGSSTQGLTLIKKKTNANTTPQSKCTHGECIDKCRFQFPPKNDSKDLAAIAAEAGFPDIEELDWNADPKRVKMKAVKRKRSKSTFKKRPR